jgi:membrane associated rhomboid family serine protease
MFQNIPVVTKNLLIINVLAYLADLVLEQGGIISLSYYGGLHFFMSPYFHFYQLITYMFLHGSFTHLFFNMFALWMFGCVIERVWGTKKYLLYYIACGVGAGLCQELVQSITGSYSLTIGASGSIYAILLAFGMTFPNERLFVFPIPIPLKAKWFIMFYVGLELFLAISQPGDGVAHMAHLGGMLFGFLLIRYWQQHPYQDFDLNNGRQFMNRMFRNRNDAFRQSRQSRQEPPSRPETDMEYNARKQMKQAEIDRILDKIRMSGYDSLTKEEKQRLFDASREK